MTVILISCGSAKKTASIDSLSGEWSIVKIDGKEIKVTEGQDLPFLGFNTKEGRVYGNAGCNLLTGALNADAKAGTIDFGALGSTRRMCPDMSLEQQVLESLGKVAQYKMMNNGKIELKDATGKTVIELNNRSK